LRTLRYEFINNDLSAVDGRWKTFKILLWDYYKWIVVGTVVMILVGIILVMGIVSTSRDPETAGSFLKWFEF
jgi:hypothetical protein